MGKLEYFRIILNKNFTIYKPNEKVIGCVELKVKEKLKIRSISILLSGNADVRWTEQWSNGKSSYTVTYHEHEDYLNSNSIFIEKKQDLDLYLEPGEYTYPFTFLLPDKIPSSFEHHYGKIRYTLKGTVDIPWSLNQHTVRSFSVYNDVDLNELNQLNKSLSQPAEVSIEKSVILSFGGPITGYLSVGKCGFVPGETIFCSARIENKSNREVCRLWIKLVQEILLTGSSREIIVKTTKVNKCYRDVVCIKVDKKIPGHSIETVFSNQPIVIPPICASSIDLCKIIQINYYVVLCYGVFGSLDKDLSLPIKIGTVPLNDVLYSTNPPSYEESVFESISEHKEKNAEGEFFESDEKTFKPLYPTYPDLNKHA